jgi:hypothetical protein
MYELSEEQIEEVDMIVEMIDLYKSEGKNRLKIWKEFRNANVNSDVILAAFRRVGMLT